MTNEIYILFTSGQDGGIGKHVWPPHATTERITARPQNNTQNYQKIELYGSPTTKDLKKPTFIHTGQWGGDVETGREARRPNVAWKDGGMCGPPCTCGG